MTASAPSAHLSTLTRHFFSRLFDFGVLSGAGSEAFIRLILGICAAILAAGLLLFRVYAGKYIFLASLESGDAWLRAVPGDHALLIGLPMWLVAFATVLAGHAVLPDDVDFRVLMALPVARWVIFAAKVLALATFGAIFTVAAHVGLFPMFLVTLLGPWDAHGVPAACAAFLVSSLAASALAVLGVTAVQGTILMLVPRHRILSFSAIARSAMVAGLVIALPFVARLTTASRAMIEGAGWIWVAPPLWFAGLEQWLLGGTAPHLSALAATAMGSVAAAGAVAAGSCLWLYRRFDRVMLVAGADGAGTGVTRGRRRQRLRKPALTAVRRFAAITLRRSVLHQGIVVAVSAIGIGVILHSYLGIGAIDALWSGARPPGAVRAVTLWSPFVLVYAMTLAVRTSLAVPCELRANWVFRLTERADHRVDLLTAATSSLSRLAAGIPLLLWSPLILRLFGAHGTAVLPWIAAWSWLFLELVMRDWSKIPFACGYLPGRRAVPELIVRGFVSFAAFTGLGAGVASLAIESPVHGLAFTMLAAGAATVLWRLRRARWRETPIAFDDDLPNDLNVLRLTD